MLARGLLPRRRRSLVHCFALVTALALPLRAASAHGRLLKADPAVGALVASSPRQLALTFSEAPTVALSRIALFDSAMRAVALGSVAADPNDETVLRARVAGVLAPGRYTVRWRIAGDDGHPVRGEYTFTVEAAPSSGAVDGVASTRTTSGFDASSPSYVVIRALQFASIVLLLGVVAMHVVVLPRLRRAGRGDAEFLAEARRRALPWATGAMWAFGAATVARLGAQHLALFGAESPWTMASVSALLLHSTWGGAWWVALVATGFGLWGLRRVASDGVHGWWMLGVSIVALTGTLSFSGHPAAAPNRALAILTDMLHLLGAGGWVGSLALLVLTGLPAALTFGHERGHQVIAGLVAEFSVTALAFASLLAITGVIAGWRNVGSWGGLWGSGYGRMLLTKLSVLSVAAGTGAYNWRRVLPSLGTPAATTRLRRSATVELAAAVLVIVLTAVLVALPLPAASMPH